MKKSTQILACLLFFCGKMMAASPPNWSVNAAAFLYSENVVAQIVENNMKLNAPGNRIGAFVGGELRGVGTPIFPTGGTAFFYFTMYSNQAAGEVVSFQIYHASADQLKAAAETPIFQHNALLGGFNSPFILHLTAGPVDFPPTLAAISEQKTLVGLPFSDLNLPSFLTSTDGDAVTFSAAPGLNLTASTAAGQLTVAPISPTWTGSDTVRITATENTAAQKKASRTVVFTRNANYAGPQFYANPSQTRLPFQAFSPFNLPNYHSFGGTCLNYGLQMLPIQGNDAPPGWAQPTGGPGSMLLTVRADFGRQQPLGGAGHVLSAWIGNTLAGVASATVVDGKNLYFLVVHNVGAGAISFKFYDAVRQKIWSRPANISFAAATTQGSVGSPVIVQLAPIAPLLLADGTVYVNIDDPLWTGQIDGIFTAKDCSFPVQKHAAMTARFRVGNYCAACSGTTFSLSNATDCQSNGTGQGGDDFFTADVSLAFNCPPSIGFVILKQGNFTRAIVSKEMLDSPSAHVFHNVQLPANGGPIQLSVEFDGCLKIGPNLGTAPVSCSLSAILSGNQAICTGSAASLPLTLTGGVGPFTVVYSDGAANFTIVGLPGGSPISVAPTSTKTYSLVSVKDADGHFAWSASGSATVVVSPTTVGGAVGLPQTICTGSSPAALNLTGQTGVVLKWQNSTDGISWNDISSTTTTFSPPVLMASTRFRAVVKSGVCPSANSNLTLITVQNLPLGGSVSQNQTICPGATAAVLTLAGQTAAIQKWQSSPDGNAWTDISNTTTSLAPGPLSAAKSYRAVVQTGVCPAVNSAAATISMLPVSPPTFGTIAPVCINASPFSLTTGLPTGGVYSGPGVSGGIFSPATAGAGSHVLIYTTTGGNGCTATASKTVVVNALPTVGLANFTAVCVNAAAFSLGGGSPAGGVFSGPGVSAGVFNPTAAGAATHTILYTVTASGCASSASKPLTVNALPTVTLADFQASCLTATPFILTGGLPAGGVFSGPGVSGGSLFTPSAAGGAGLKTLTYSFANANGCAATASKTLLVEATCATSCVIATCPAARNVNIGAGCKITIPDLLPEVVAGSICQSPVAKIQSPAAGTLVAKTHNSTQNVVITVTDAAGNTATCTTILTAKDVTGPTFTNCVPSNSTATMSAGCKISIPNIAALITATDCTTGGLVKTQVPAANTLFSAVHNQPWTVVVTATDAAGNTATCTRIVLAKDYLKPVITTCPPAQTVPLSVDCKLTVPNKMGQLAASEACSNPLLITQNPAAGTVISSGPGMTHTLVFTVIDAANNAQTCSAILTGGTCTMLLVGQHDREAESEKAPVFMEKSGETSLNLNENQPFLQTSPNPFDDELTIEFELSELVETELALMDLTGRFLFLEKENRFDAGRQKVVWNTGVLPVGAYLVGLKTGVNGWIWRKVMLVR